jgi:hypothetical protein
VRSVLTSCRGEVLLDRVQLWKSVREWRRRVQFGVSLLLKVTVIEALAENCCG